MDVGKTIEEIVRCLPHLVGFGQTDTKINKKTEADIAYEIAEAVSKLPFCRAEGVFFHYEGTRYVNTYDKKTGDQMAQLILGVMDRLNIGKVYMFGSIPGILKMISNNHKIPIFKPSKSIISFRNCILNMADMTTTKHDPKWMTRIFFDFDYDPKATCRLWDEFLVTVLPDDYEGRQILQEFLGLMFVDPSQLAEEKALFLYGTGSNGKSVVQDVICSMLGKDNFSSYDLSQLCTASDAGYNLADINGKLLNFASDMGDKDFSGGRFKALVARDPIQARMIGQPPFLADELPLLISNINKMPITTDSTHGYWRRYMLIYFNVHFDDEKMDRSLKSKLRKEISGIFNWILIGRKRLLENKGKFTTSLRMQGMLNDAKRDSNSVLSFIDENGYKGINSGAGLVTRVSMFTKDLMNLYSDYCRIYKNSPKSKTNFIADLKGAGFEYKDKMRKGSEVSTGFIFYKPSAYGEEIASLQDEDSYSENTIEDDGMPF